MSAGLQTHESRLYKPILMKFFKDNLVDRGHICLIQVAVSGQMVFWQLFSSLLINSIVTDGDYYFIIKVSPAKGKITITEIIHFNTLKKKMK